MEILVTAKPHMLLETVELMYAYMNHTPPEQLAGSGPYSLPVSAVQEMLDVACNGLSREDEMLRFFFDRYILSDEPRRDTCIARNLAYNLGYVGQGSVAKDCDRLRRIWNNDICKHNSIVAVGDYCLHWVAETEGPVIPVVEGLDSLAVDASYIRKLHILFADYDRSVAQLKMLVEPVAEKLELLLQPWAQRAEELAQTRQTKLQQRSYWQELLGGIQISFEEDVHTCWIQNRYLQPTVAPGNLYLVSNEVFIHLGVEVEQERKLELARKETIQHWELEALRLLGSDSRLKMLRVLLEKPLSTRELAQTLEMNLGSVARDIRSMFDARLLTVETENNRVFYRTNVETMELLGKHIAQLGKFYPL
ncbi:MAG: winged helix-turn-helix transcriptional regulator [Ruminococcaceae bacterium]|nr:winged helix-turn-helix transcriptional regulator [Oscillospiraceae bacterium]